MFKKLFIIIISLIFVSCGELDSADYASKLDDGSFEETDVKFSQAATTAPAFPGALGFGRIATGGRGGTLLFVTNLSDDINTKGSLRWALNQNYKRTILFKIGGLLKISKSLEINYGNVTIAGQTAPGKGFAIRGSRLLIKASNVIVRGLKFRVGGVQSDGPKIENENRDGISIGAENKYIDRVVVDSNSIAWSVDESLAAWGNLKNITFSNNLVSEALRNSIHPKGRHSMAFVIGQQAGLTFPSRITVIRNMLGNSMFRCPLIKGSTQVEVVNNYCFNFQKNVEFDNPVQGHYVKNLYEQGSSSSKSFRPIGSLAGSSRAYLKDNRDLWFRTSSTRPESDIAYGDLSLIKSAPLFTKSVYSEIAVTNLKSYLLTHTGARNRRDDTDVRILDTFKNRTARLIDSQSQVGGWETYPRGTYPTDTDGDGMPDAFEKAKGLNPNVKDHNGTKLGGGYTNLEHYINSLLN